MRTHGFMRNREPVEMKGFLQNTVRLVVIWRLNLVLTCLRSLSAFDHAHSDFASDATSL